MQTTNIWNSKYVLLRKIGLLFFSLFIFSQSAIAQGEKMNNRDHDFKKFYFGIMIGLNSSQYKMFHDEYFIQYDSIKEITPLWKPGFQLGIAGNLRLSNFIDVRTVPSFVLREKSVRYRFPIQGQADSILTNNYESILFSWPFEFKFKSDRQENFRFYALAGGKIDYDFNSSVSKRRTDELLRVRPFDYGYNLGVGFEFYFPNFILAPEIKLSQGLRNILIKDDNDEQTAKAVERINTRMIMFSLFIQG